jgi:TRAP-type C4-dicarboxylate transport system permease small subunit
MSIKTRIDKLLEYTLIVLMSVLVLDVLWQVLSRYILSSPSSFTDELAGFLLIWVGVLGAAYVAGRQEHLAIDLLVQRSTPQNRKKLQVTIHICIALFALAVMVVGGIWLVATRFMFNVNSAALHLPLGYVYLIIPISGLLIIWYSLLFIFKPEGGKA